LSHLCDHRRAQEFRAALPGSDFAAPAYSNFQAKKRLMARPHSIAAPTRLSGPEAKKNAWPGGGNRRSPGQALCSDAEERV
jgi:hypothetical protein